MQKTVKRIQSTFNFALLALNLFLLHLYSMAMEFAETAPQYYGANNSYLKNLLK